MFSAVRCLRNRIGNNRCFTTFSPIKVNYCLIQQRSFYCAGQPVFGTKNDFLRSRSDHRYFLNSQAYILPNSTYRGYSKIIEAEYIEKEVKLGDETENSSLHSDDSDLDSDFDPSIKKPTKPLTIRPKSFPAGSETAELWEMIDEHRRNDEAPPIFLYHKLLKSYVSKRWIRRSFLVMEEIQELGPGLDTTCFNIVCNYKLESGDFAEIPEIYAEMKIAGLEYDAESYRVLFILAAETEDEESLSKWMGIMEEKQIPMTMELYKVYISFCKVTRQPEKAFSFIEEMKTQTPKPLLPNVEITNILLGLFMEDGKLHESQQVIDLMDEYKIKANFNTYEITMLGYLVTENYDEVDRLFHEMAEQFQYRTVLAYTLLMKRYFLVGDVEAGVTIFEKAIENRMDLTTEIYTTLIEGLCESQLLDEAQQYFSTMLEENIALNLYLIEVLLESFMNEKMFVEAENLISLARDAGIRFEPSTFKILVDSCLENGMTDQALNWVAEFRTILPNFHPSLEFYEQCIRAGPVQQGASKYTIPDIMKWLGISENPLPREEALAKESKDPVHYNTTWLD